MFFSALHQALEWEKHSILLHHGPYILTLTLWDVFSSLKRFQSLFSCTKIIKTRIFTFLFNLKINLNWINMSVQAGIIPQCKVPPLFPIHIHICTHLFIHFITAVTPIPAGFLHKTSFDMASFSLSVKQINQNNFLNIFNTSFAFRIFKRGWYTLRSTLDSAERIKRKSNKALRSSE